MVPMDGEYRQPRDYSIRKDIPRSSIFPHSSEETTYSRRVQRELYHEEIPEKVVGGYLLVLS